MRRKTMFFKKTMDTDERIFSLLHPLVKQWFQQKFSTFTPAQKFAVTEIHARKNILVTAPTGSGKTLTAFLAILSELVDAAEKGILEDKVYAVYISPLKALNRDISVNLLEPLKEIEALSEKPLGIRIGLRTGDTTVAERAKMLRKPPHILITTPESLAIILNSPRFVQYLGRVDWCIVDEVHALAENKRGVHLSITLERLQRLAKHICRVGLSATVAPLEDVAAYLVGFDHEKQRDCLIADVQFVKSLNLKVVSPVSDLISTPHHEAQKKIYILLHEYIQQHRSTLIFTNTRSGTERVVNQLKDYFPKHYTDETIGTHHSSMSKTMRHSVENNLKEGKLKAVVSSTSLELGIDIGYIDLVLLLGSPKSVARAIQRIGRAGHQLNETSKGRFVVLDRDDLVECAVLLKHALERNIDKIHIPTNCLDVASQHIFGIAVAEQIEIHELFGLLRNSYCYHTLLWNDFMEVIQYLRGAHIPLEARHIYAKIWHDEETGMIGRKGRLSRVIYMTNIGTIPEESHVRVKIGEQVIGQIDEAFLERLKPGDVFVLGGAKYQFRFSRGLVAQVVPAEHRQPTIPSWFSEMLPLSFDLAMGIGRFRRLVEERLANKKSKKEVLAFIQKYLTVDENAAEALYIYLQQQYAYAEIPHDKRIVLEHYRDGNKRYAVFHTMFGRRVNDCLSRAVAFTISKTDHRDVEIGITDNGFYVAHERPFNAVGALRLLVPEKINLIMQKAIEKTEVLKRRFRHCATRSLMILRQYKGQRKNVGRQQVSSMILLSAVRQISLDFPILKEARREVLEDLMDIQNTKVVLEQLKEKKMRVKEVTTDIPSPFAFKLVLESQTDFLKMEERLSFLKRMHEEVLKRI